LSAAAAWPLQPQLTLLSQHLVLVLGFKNIKIGAHQIGRISVFLKISDQNLTSQTIRFDSILIETNLNIVVLDGFWRCCCNEHWVRLKI
jgi:hypothetical protein